MAKGKRITHRTEALKTAWVLVGTVAIALAAAACGTAQPSVPPPASAASTASTTSATPVAVQPTEPVTTGSPCAPVVPASLQGPSATAQVLSEGAGDDPRVSAVVYPRPDYAGNPWSQWGQGVVLDDGRFLSAIGDHRGVDGNSFLFAYEPEPKRLTRFADVLSLVEREPGSFGYGKIHAQMVKVGCDSVVFGTYWGTRNDLRYGGSYTGDRLFSIDPSTLAIDSLGIPVPEHGIPSLAGHGRLVYGEAVDPRGRPAGQSGDIGNFFVFDTERREVIYRSDDQRHIGFRSMAVDAAGRAFVAMPQGGLLRYTPGAALTVHEASLPAGWLRAASEPGPDGTVYAVTTQPERYVALRPDGTVKDIGPASSYIAGIAVSPAGNELLVVPGAHGEWSERGAPLLAVEIATGRERVVVTPGPMVKERLGLVLAGSYNLAVDQRSGRIFIGYNAGSTSDKPWGEVVLVTVEP